MRDNATIDHQEPPFPDDPGPDQAPANVEHLPPSDITAEQYVIGSVLLSPDALEQCQRTLQPADFYEPSHETIWHAITQLQALDLPVEPVSLLNHLREHGHLKRIRGDYLIECIQTATIPPSAPHYARIVHQLARRRTALTALRKATQRLNAPGPDIDTDETLRDAADALAASVEAIANPNPTTTWSPVDLDAALDGQSLDPPPEMLTRSDGINLFYTGGIHTVSGESESGKTWFCLLGAVQLMSIGMQVVFIDFEDRAERVIGRLRTLGATADQIRAGFRYIRPDRPLNTVGQHELAPHLEHAMLVIIDGVTEAMTVHGFDLNSNEDAAKFFGLLPRWIADHGPAVAMIDHVVKDKEKQGRYALGAQHKLAGIDAAAYTVKVITAFGRGKRGMARIDVAKDRPGHVREYATGDRIAEFTLDDTNPGGMVATLDPPTQTPTTEDGTWAPTILMEKISKYVYGNPNCTVNNVLDAVGGKATAKRQALDLLVRRGHISIETGPRNSKLHHHVSHFPPLDDEPEPDVPDNPWEPSS